MASSKSINTLSEFLLQAQTQYIVFDLGRGLRQLDKQVFFEWENQQSPCAFPRQNHAWFCIAFWNKSLSEQQYIWFIKLPVDENGLIDQASRNQFLEIIISALGRELEHSQEREGELPENPFVFTPSQQQMADCNAHIKKELGILPPPKPEVERYLKSPLTQEWESLSLQDIANFICACESSESNNHDKQAIIARNIKLYPDTVLSCLYASLESIEIKQVLLQALIDKHQSIPNSTLRALCLRSFSFKPNAVTETYIGDWLESDDKLDLESAVVLAGRYWKVLINDNNLMHFMHKVAELDSEFTVFKSLYSDLVKVPDARVAMLNLLRNQNRTDLVAKAIGALFASFN